jgi:hypothetical protein
MPGADSGSALSEVVDQVGHFGQRMALGVPRHPWPVYRQNHFATTGTTFTSTNPDEIRSSYPTHNVVASLTWLNQCRNQE